MEPSNDLDRAILAARAGSLSQQDFIAALVHSTIAVPSRTEVLTELSEIRPILLDKGNETFVAAFTEPSYADAFRHMAGFCVEIEALAWLRAIPRDIGLVINPGMDAAIQFSAAGVQQIVRNFSPVPIN
ncbi:SseB family protein [Terriglobus aquaticus]|uniref:SseB family protein n=1 Tax=Terriglobus aquaticus TaxID=940139 RepID=A0ABW9KN97_9BACT|nr:SseB family protein [Terriglobus aquaticus]